MTISVLLCVATIVTNYLGFDVTALAGLAGASLLTNGAWGGFYFWKAKNENRAKYAQRFLNRFADKYGADIALTVLLPEERWEDYLAHMLDITAGTVEGIATGERFQDVPWRPAGGAGGPG